MIGECIIDKSAASDKETEQKCCLVKLENIIKKYGKKTAALNNVSIKIDYGRIVGLVGPNGSGKTTLLKILLGLLKPDSGKAELMDYDVSRSRIALKNVGFVLDQPGLYSFLTGRENLLLSKAIYDGVTDSEIDHVLRLTGMDRYADNKVKTYSLGMKQRLAIAMAILHKPKLIILDEPMNSLDPEFIIDMRNILKEYAAVNNAGIIITSHRLEDIHSMCDSVHIMYSGRIVDTVLNPGEQSLHDLEVLYKNTMVKCRNEFDLETEN